MHYNTLKRDNDSTVRGDGGSSIFYEFFCLVPSNWYLLLKKATFQFTEYISGNRLKTHFTCIYIAGLKIEPEKDFCVLKTPKMLQTPFN